MSPSPLKKGDQVEVCKAGQFSTGPYYPATVLRSPASSKVPVLVQYQTLSDESEGSRREYVDWENVRPAPPQDLSVGCFKPGDDVDAFLRNSWWRRGTVADVLDNSRYSVLLPETARRREIVCQHWNLRLHRDWNCHDDGGSWVPTPEDQINPCTREFKECTIKLKFVLRKKPPELKFEIGASVEVTSDEEGYKKSWYVAKIIGPIGSERFLVEHCNLVTNDGTRPLREEAEARHIRPAPPLLPAVNHFKKFEKVDAWYNDGWWEGVVSKVRSGREYAVYFSTTNEELMFKHSDLRRHQDWINGKWIVASKEDPSKWGVNLDGVNLGLEDSVPTFGAGMKVEIKSDEEGYQGSWYAARILVSFPNSKFLVEYETLKTEDETRFLKEVVDAIDIRPCPPEIQRVYQFAVLENVDCWYNDGWWVGRISKVLTGSRYIVYFWTTAEELEFDHCYLRPHQEWADGKWV